MVPWLPKYYGSAFTFNLKSSKYKHQQNLLLFSYVPCNNNNINHFIVYFLFWKSFVSFPTKHIKFYTHTLRFWNNFTTWVHSLYAIYCNFCVSLLISCRWQHIKKDVQLNSFNNSINFSQLKYQFTCKALSRHNCSIFLWSMKHKTCIS